jgi:hypothetical protein
LWESLTPPSSPTRCFSHFDKRPCKSFLYLTVKYAFTHTSPCDGGKTFRDSFCPYSSVVILHTSTVNSPVWKGGKAVYFISIFFRYVTKNGLYISPNFCTQKNALSLSMCAIYYSIKCHGASRWGCK